MNGMRRTFASPGDLVSHGLVAATMWSGSRRQIRSSVLWIMRVSCFVALFLLAASVGFGQELRWKFSAGDRFEVSFEQRLVQATEVNDKPFSSSVNFEMQMLWKVTEVKSNGNALMEQSFTELKVEGKTSSGDTFSFDSQSQEDLDAKAKKVAKSLNAILSSTFQVEMSPRGELVSVETDEATMKKLRSAPDSMQIRRLFTKEGISKTLSQATVLLPEEEIAEGESWKAEDVLKTPLGTSTYSRTYTLAGTEDVDGKSVQKIDLQGSVSFEQALQDEAQKPQKIVENEQDGMLLFDSAEGNFVAIELKQMIATETPYREMVIKAATESELKTKIVRLAKE